VLQLGMWQCVRSPLFLPRLFADRARVNVFEVRGEDARQQWQQWQCI